MLFSAPIFLFFFLPLAVLLYQAVPKPWRNATILAISIAFYGWAEPRFVFVILGLSVLDYLLGMVIVQGGRRGRICLGIGILSNISLLFAFKYLDFTFQNLVNLLGPLPQLNWLLPLGISFIVFEKITYLVDIHRGTGKPARTIWDYLLFVFLFPKMLAGPIIKYREMEPFLRERSETVDDLIWGFRRFLWGLSKKVLVADVAGEVADAVFGLPSGQIGFAGAWIGVIAFTVQIYFDFSGYSDMAIGIARMFGFRLRENFDHPYGSASFTEFWRRWHISLSTWIRDYLYIPLGGSRYGAVRTYANLWVCFLLSGLWHGANWNFVLWGAYNGFFLIADRLFWLRIADRLPRVLAVGVTLFFIMAGWTIFRATSVPQMNEILLALVSPWQTGAFVWVQPHQYVALAFGFLGSLAAATGTGRALVDGVERHPAWRSLAVLPLMALSTLAVLKALTVTFNPFLYFRF